MSNTPDEATKSRDQNPRAGQDEKDTPRSGEDKPNPLAEKNRDMGFHPIRIPGEPLSETIIRERRERPY
jgi:hypothetical protein